MFVVQFYDEEHRSMLRSDGSRVIRDLKTVQGAERRAAHNVPSRARTYEVFRVNPERFYDQTSWKQVAGGHVDSLKAMRSGNRALSLEAAADAAFGWGWNDWVASNGQGEPRSSSREYLHGWKGAQKAAQSGISVEPIGSPAYHAALKELRSAGLVKSRNRLWPFSKDGPEYSWSSHSGIRSTEVGKSSDRQKAVREAIAYSKRTGLDVTVGGVDDESAWHIGRVSGGKFTPDPRDTNRAGTRSRTRKSPLTAATRVATLASLGVSYDSSLFYSVKGGKLYARARTGGGGYGRGRLGKATLLGTIPGFKKGVFYSVSNGVISVRKRK
jgi:hypothetical protein